MNIELIKAILHVLDPAVDAPILSEAILPPSEDALQYLAGHAAKCFASDEAKARLQETIDKMSKGEIEISLQ